MKAGERASPRKIIPIAAQAADAAQASGSLYEAHITIHPRSIKGQFARWRWTLVWLTQIVFYGLPWLEWGQRQMVLFDLGARRFYLFGWVLYPQDFIYLTGLLVLSALALFLFTAVAGRLWCGFSCPQTVYTEIFMWIERKVEGERSARLRLDASGWSLEKVAKKTTKHGLWLLLALWTGFSFVGYFVPIRALGAELLAWQGSWQLFWVGFYGLATYGNAGFLREQVCKYMCPYARFQSAMFDRDTWIVSYDAARGETRGPRSKNLDSKAAGLGDCIDCKLCLQVCPVGIDIRDGLQYECIGCGLCIDACNTVMDKMGYARGLVRLDTQKGGASAASLGQRLRLVLRPRVLIYSAVLLGLSAAMVISLALREPLRVNVIRDRAALARIVAGGQLENVYRLQIMNATEQPQHYRVFASGLPGLTVSTDSSDFAVDAAQTRAAALRLRIPYGSAEAGSHPVLLQVQAIDGHGGHVTEKTVFLVPR